MSRVTFDVYGSAQPQGSKSLMPNGAMLEGGTAELRANRRNWRSAVVAISRKMWNAIMALEAERAA